MLAGWPATVPLHRLVGFSGYLGPAQARGRCPKPQACMGLVCQCGEKTQTSLIEQSCRLTPMYCCAMASCGMALACQCVLWPRGCRVGLPATRRKPSANTDATNSTSSKGLGAGAFALALVWWWAYPMAQGACTSLAC